MSTKLPRAIQAQVDAANKLVDTMNATSAEGTPNAEQTTEAPATEAPAVRAVQETPAPAPTEAPAPAPQASSDDWEHKYRVLQGMFKAEVKRQVDAATQSMQAQNDQMRALVATLQAPAAPAAPQTMSDTRYSFVKPDETEEYGEELLDVAARKAKEQYLPMIESLQAKIAQLEGSVQQSAQRVETVEQVTAQTAREKFFSALDVRLPTWEKLNVDPGFLSWLDAEDSFTGLPRRTLFNQAYNGLNVDRVATFFTTYAASTGTPVAAAAPAPSMKPTVSLENLQAPGKPRTAPPTTEKKFISRSDIAAFYNRQRQGFYRGKEADAARFEQEIFSAQAEGRIT